MIKLIKSDSELNQDLLMKTLSGRKMVISMHGNSPSLILKPSHKSPEIPVECTLYQLGIFVVRNDTKKRLYAGLIKEILVQCKLVKIHGGTDIFKPDNYRIINLSTHFPYPFRFTPKTAFAMQGNI